ncbi:hypothetical protein VP01_674g2 [Puccinia sorghi]|uniref:Uncharacterized protein n=1 Tax=Puccinia sorghi TaxID=27349 RepID=A0A0L6UEP6_9BASI|nr:hypothetical protein VP01_674g2 [Puccinia sorghi]
MHKSCTVNLLPYHSIITALYIKKKVRLKKPLSEDGTLSDHTFPHLEFLREGFLSSLCSFFFNNNRVWTTNNGCPSFPYCLLSLYDYDKIACLVLLEIKYHGLLDVPSYPQYLLLSLKKNTKNMESRYDNEWKETANLPQQVPRSEGLVTLVSAKRRPTETRGLYQARLEISGWLNLNGLNLNSILCLVVGGNLTLFVFHHQKQSVWDLEIDVFCLFLFLCNFESSWKSPEIDYSTREQKSTLWYMIPAKVIFFQEYRKSTGLGVQCRCTDSIRCQFHLRKQSSISFSHPIFLEIIFEFQKTVKDHKENELIHDEELIIIITHISYDHHFMTLVFFLYAMIKLRIWIRALLVSHHQFPHPTSTGSFNPNNPNHRSLKKQKQLSQKIKNCLGLGESVVGVSLKHTHWSLESQPNILCKPILSFSSLEDEPLPLPLSPSLSLTLPRLMSGIFYMKYGHILWLQGRLTALSIMVSTESKHALHNQTSQLGHSSNHCYFVIAKGVSYLGRRFDCWLNFRGYQLNLGPSSPKFRLNLCTTYNQHTTGISSVYDKFKRKKLHFFKLISKAVLFSITQATTSPWQHMPGVSTL